LIPCLVIAIGEVCNVLENRTVEGTTGKKFKSTTEWSWVRVGEVNNKNKVISYIKLICGLLDYEGMFRNQKFFYPLHKIVWSAEAVKVTSLAQHLKHLGIAGLNCPFWSQDKCKSSTKRYANFFSNSEL